MSKIKKSDNIKCFSAWISLGSTGGSMYTYKHFGKQFFSSFFIKNTPALCEDSWVYLLSCHSHCILTPHFFFLTEIGKHDSQSFSSGSSLHQWFSISFGSSPGNCPYLLLSSANTFEMLGIVYPTFFWWFLLWYIVNYFFNLLHEIGLFLFLTSTLVNFCYHILKGNQ